MSVDQDDAIDGGVDHGAKSRLPPYPPYRARFVNPRRIDAALRYWSAYEPELRRAEAEFGVPAEVILGILGVETAFGRNTGTFRVLDALATIAFDGRRRQDYFREELKQFLLLSSEHRLDPLAIRGSYAGAIGLPQFLPSSIRNYAVDFDGDRKIDLVGSPTDAIGSVANFLKKHGWEAGGVVAVKVGADDTASRPLIEEGIQPQRRPDEMRAKYLRTRDFSRNGKTASLELAVVPILI